jgi:hypothetical protein
MLYRVGIPDAMVNKSIRASVAAMVSTMEKYMRSRVRGEKHFSNKTIIEKAGIAQNAAHIARLPTTFMRSIPA